MGSGSGFLTLAMAKCMDKGLCVGVEHIPELVEISKNAISKYHDNKVSLNIRQK